MMQYNSFAKYLNVVPNEKVPTWTEFEKDIGGLQVTAIEFFIKGKSEHDYV